MASRASRFCSLTKDPNSINSEEDLAAERAGGGLSVGASIAWGACGRVPRGGDGGSPGGVSRGDDCGGAGGLNGGGEEDGVEDKDSNPRGGNFGVVGGTVDLLGVLGSFDFAGVGGRISLYLLGVFLGDLLGST